MSRGIHLKTEFHKGHIPWNKGKNGLYKPSEDTKKKISQNSAKIWLGKKLSEEHKRKLSESHKGKIPKCAGWNKGLPKELQPSFGKSYPAWNKGTKGICKSNSGTLRAGVGRPNPGFKKGNQWGKRKWTIAMRKKASDSARKRVIDGRHNSWRGGITPENKRIRKSIEFRLWREAVFARDNWTCQKCKIKGMRLHPHHIQSFAKYPKQRFAIDNGITLCEKCHRKLHGAAQNRETGEWEV